jgi:hypothetical protein
MKKIILTLTLALLPLAVVTPNAHAKSCGVYYVTHTSNITGKYSVRHVYRCSK